MEPKGGRGCAAINQPGADEMAEEESEAVWEATKTKGSRVTAYRACPKFQCQDI